MYCSNCGSLLQQGSQFCESCGTQIPAPASVPANFYANPTRYIIVRKKRPLNIVYIILSIIILLIGITAFLLLSGMVQI